MDDLLNEKTVDVGLRFDDWKAAVRYSGQLLVDQEYIEKRYVDSMIQNIEDLGPYIIIAPEVAMPHSRPEDGVIKKGVSVVILENEVFFSNQKPVKVLITLAAEDNQSHINLLQKISSVISNESTLKNLKASTNKEQVLQIFNKLMGDE